MPDQINQSVFAQIDISGSVVRVRLIGPSIGQREVQILTELITPVIEESLTKGGWLALDATQITFVNSMGLGMFIDFRNRAAKRGGKVALIGMNQQLLDLFKMVKVDRLFTIVADENALAAKIKS